MSKKTKKVRIGDILTFTTGRLVSDRRMDAVYEIVNFMTGEPIFTHQLPRVGRLIEVELKKQLPWTDSPEMQFEEAKLGMMLEPLTEKRDIDNLIQGWIMQQIATYGEFHEIEAFTAESGYESIDPVFEAVGMIGGDPDRVIKVG